MTEWDIAIRLVVALLCGAAIGLEREYFKHPAGHRTFALVCLASALAMVVQLYITDFANSPDVSVIARETVKVDIGRIAGQVLTGIGFIGAGLIMKNHDSISGLTTATCIFMTAVIGLAVGAGMIVPGCCTTVVVVFLLATSQVFKKRKGKKKAASEESAPEK